MNSIIIKAINKVLKQGKWIWTRDFFKGFVFLNCYSGSWRAIAVVGIKVVFAMLLVVFAAACSKGGNTTPADTHNLLAPTSYVSGAVHYGGTQTGNIYVSVMRANCTGQCGTGYGTFIRGSAGGPYTIYGVPLGKYVVTAELVPANPGDLEPGNAWTPLGMSSAITIDSASFAVQADVTIADRTPPAPVTPKGLVVAGGDAAAALSFDVPFNNLGEIIASSYKLDWGTDANASTGGGSITLTPNSDGQYFINRHFTNGAKLYFKVTALVGATESAASAVVGPVTIGTQTGGNTVSGTVAFPTTVYGPLYVGLYNPDTETVTYIASFAHPANPQAFTITGVQNGSYQIVAIIDGETKGYVSAEDAITHPTTPVAVNGASSGNDITLSSASAVALVRTYHQQFTDGTPGQYSLNMQVLSGLGHPVEVQLIYGPNVNYRVDISPTDSGINYPVAATPAAGDVYEFLVTFQDGTSAKVSSSVTGVVNSFALNPAAAPAGSTAPTFSWSAPASPPGYYAYFVDVHDGGGNLVWSYPPVKGMPSTQTSVAFNADGRASSPSLTSGVKYSWTVAVRDVYGNRAIYQSAYTP